MCTFDSEGHPDGLFARQTYLRRNNQVELEVQGAYTQWREGGWGNYCGIIFYINFFMLLS